MYDRHLYPGGACRLHTLRKEIGDDIFWAAVKDYLHTYQESVVETDDFRRIVEKHCGKSLQKFFDQWIMTPAYPDVKVTFAFDKERNEGTFIVEQKQFDKKKDIPAFNFTTQLSWVIDGKEHRRPITLEDPRHSFNVAMTKDPEQVRFDPDWVVLHKLEFNPGDTKLKAQLTGAKDVHGRILAANALIKTAKRENLRFVADAYHKETFWGVRREMLAAFGTCHTEDSIDILVEIIGKESDHLVLDFVFESAKNFRDEKILNATAERFAKGGLPPKARAAAIKVLGAQREQAPLKTLIDAVMFKEPRYGFSSSTAMMSLGMSRMEEALDILIEQSVYGKNPTKSRRGAADGIGILLPNLPKNIHRKAEECLVDLLRDPDDWMRRAAAGALFSARVQWAEPALLSFRVTLPYQDQMDFDGRLASLRKGGESKLADLEKQVEDVNGRYRKLLERLENIEGRLTKS